MSEPVYLPERARQQIDAMLHEIYAYCDAVLTGMALDGATGVNIFTKEVLFAPSATSGLPGGANPGGTETNGSEEPAGDGADD